MITIPRDYHEHPPHKVAGTCMLGSHVGITTESHVFSVSHKLVILSCGSKASSLGRNTRAKSRNFDQEKPNFLRSKKA